MEMVVLFMVVNMALAMILSATFVAAASSAGLGSDQIAKPGCDHKCGSLQIPYPFGMKKGCYLNDTFLITCNTTHYDPPKAFIGDNIEVTNISIDEGEVHILRNVAKHCYQKDNPSDSTIQSLTLPDSYFTISNTKNKFTVIGCGTIAILYGQLQNQTYRTAPGCFAWCLNNDITTQVRDGSCSGNGCCQLEIPQGLQNMELLVLTIYNHSTVLHFNPCGYAFVIQQDKFTFSSTYIANFSQQTVPMVLDWGIKNDTCLTSLNKTNCLCGPNSQRNSSFSIDGSEYRCQCSNGYMGNPYLPQGCRNIDECTDGLHDCLSIHHCEDKDGYYNCKCPKNYKGDGKKDGKGCTQNPKSFIPIIIGIGVGFIVLLIGSTCLYLGYKKWKFIQQKERFFKNNGGFLLQQHLSQGQSSVDTVRIFTQEELEKATNNYDESTVAGRGGFGTVYKGVLDDGLVVAIKKSKLVDQSQTDQFINEVVVLSQINHRNVVRLIGCCLETQVPLLVYEFITNGTLYEHIHDKANHVSLPWEARLKIASEAAGVVSYLHSAAFIPIIHRDIKSTNVLLDHNYTAKVSDFGASKLVPMDQTQLSTMVQGTLGYLDPEYLLTSELTEKSDVYSFGIVLMELITGKKAVSYDAPEAERNLAMYVLCAMKEDRLEQVVDKEIMVTEENFQQIKEVAKLAKECVKVKGEERPSMKEVAMKLEGLRVMQVEIVSLLDQTYSDSLNQFVVSNHINNDMGNSIKGQILTHIPDAR